MGVDEHDRYAANSYVKKLKDAVDRAKKNREWRHEYMTLLMRDCPVAHKPAVQGVHIFFKRLNLAGQCIDGFLIIRFQLKVCRDRSDSKE